MTLVAILPPGVSARCLRHILSVYRGAQRYGAMSAPFWMGRMRLILASIRSNKRTSRSRVMAASYFAAVCRGAMLSGLLDRLAWRFRDGHIGYRPRASRNTNVPTHSEWYADVSLFPGHRHSVGPAIYYQLRKKPLQGSIAEFSTVKRFHSAVLVASAPLRLARCSFWVGHHSLQRPTTAPSGLGLRIKNRVPLFALYLWVPFFVFALIQFLSR